MIDKLQKGLVALVYGVGRVRNQYSKAHPTERILAADGSKGITTKSDKGVERGLDWVTSQRAVVLLTDTKIKCGKWEIPLESVDSAQLLEINSLFGKGLVLKLKTKDNNYYQFGMQFNPEWTNQKALPLSIEEGKVNTSTFSWILRLILLGYIVYYFMKKFEVM